jgi:hypothetical protein
MAINEYSKNISINWGDDVLYYVGVQVQLEQIARRRTGRALLRAIGSFGREVVIQPWPDKDNPGANTGTESVADAQSATPTGQQLLTCNRGNAGKPILQDGKPLMGTGGGSRSVIRFSPEVSEQIRGPGNDADEVLLHELAHAYRMSQGLHRCERMGDSYDAGEDWDSIEEFFAILIANIYRSECRRQGLRADHFLKECPGKQRKGHTVCLRPLSAALTDEAAFYEHYKPKMEQLFTPPRMRAVGSEIAIWTDCDFNPLYEYGRWHWGLGEKVPAAAGADN